MTLCPTCGRLPSGRIGIHALIESDGCTDPIHDAADAGPGLLAAMKVIAAGKISSDLANPLGEWAAVAGRFVNIAQVAIKKARPK